MKKTILKKSWLLLSVFVATIAFTFAQRTITGTVTDASGENLIGANVLIKGTNTGTVTDIDGSYSLEIPKDTTVLIFSYTGYATIEVCTGKSPIIDAVLNEGFICCWVMACGMSEEEYWFQETQKLLAQKAELRRINAEKRRLRRIKRKEKRADRKEAKQIAKALEKLEEGLVFFSNSSPLLEESVNNTENIDFSTLLSRTSSNSNAVNIREIPKIELFPNPVAKILNVQFKTPFTNSTTIEVYNERGILVKTDFLQAKQKSTEINLEALPTGFYILRVQNEKTFIHKKIIKQ